MIQKHSAAAGSGSFRGGDERDPAWFKVVTLTVWCVAGVVAFLPFALNTSPWDAVTLHVPGHQGNWWHALVGFPFFLAFPGIWLRLRSLHSDWFPSLAGRRVIWCLVALSSVGTVAVETPFLLHLAGTNGWPRLSLLIVGLGILIVCAVLLFMRRHRISAMRACLIGLETAYLANLSLVLIVYSGAAGGAATRVGWMISIVMVWPMLLELAWLFSRRSPRQAVGGGLV